MENLKADICSSVDRVNIVIVDDDPAINELLSKYLSKNNYTVICFTVPSLALEYLRCHPANFLLTDLHMPEMNGIELINAIKKFKPDLPIILMSGTYDPTLLDELDRLKGVQRIAKPFKLEMLKQIIVQKINPEKSQESNESVANASQIY